MLVTKLNKGLSLESGIRATMADLSASFEADRVRAQVSMLADGRPTTLTRCACSFLPAYTLMYATIRSKARFDTETLRRSEIARKMRPARVAAFKRRVRTSDKLQNVLRQAGVS